MGVRLEKVVLDLEDRLTAGVLRAAAAVDVLDQALDQLPRASGKSKQGIDGLANSAVRSRASLAGTTSEIEKIGKSAGRAGPEIDRLSGRVRILADVAAILGPGFIPVAAIAAPALTGIATALTAVVAAGGGAVVAFQGVGDAIEALEKARLEPTLENMQEAERLLQGLGSNAAEFALAFQEFRPVLTGIRDAAAAGLFPGLTDSLDDFEALAPRIESLLKRVNQATGDAIADGAESLASDRWADFIAFLEVELPAATTQTARILGDIGHGASEMWMQLDPGNDSFLAWLGDVAEGFDSWASSAEGAEDMEAFLDYLRETGPLVEDFFVSGAGAITDLVQAAAPLSGVVLQGLTTVFDIISGIADSDLGTPIMTGVAALAIYNRTLAATASLQTRMNAGGVGFAGGFLAPTRDSVKNALTALTTVTTAQDRARLSTAALAQVERERAATVRAGVAATARAAAGIGGLALVASGAADGLGIANTASLALMGAMVGGVGGAVAGGLAGAYLDVRQAGTELVTSTKQLDAVWASSTSTVQEWAAAYKTVGEDLAAGQRDNADFLSNFFVPDLNDPFDPLKDAWARLDLAITGDNAMTEAAESTAKVRSEVLQLEGALTDLEARLAGGGGGGGDNGPWAEYGRVAEGAIDLTDSFENIDKMAARVQPALDELGYTLKDMVDPEIAAEVEAYIRNYDTGATRMQAFRDSVSGLSDQMYTNADAAAAMGAALDALLDPALNAEATTDAWRQSLQQLRADLDADAGFKGFSEAAMANRELTRSYVEGSKARLVAMAENGAGEQKMAASVRQTRTEFIQAGIAAGFSREEITRRANAMGLTPKMVRTVFEAAGLDLSVARARDALAAYRSLPKNVRTEIQSQGIPQTMGQVNALVRRYDLTEKQRRALLTLIDRASPGIKTVQGLLDKAGRGANPRITVTSNAAAVAGAAIRSMNSVQDRTVTLTIRRLTTGAQIGNAMGGLTPADGTTVPGPRYPYADKIPAILAPGEEVISNRHGQADRHRHLLKLINANRLADGGTAAGARSLAARSYAMTPELRQRLILEDAAREAAEAVGQFGDALDESVTDEGRRRKEREKAIERDIAGIEKSIAARQQERDALAEAISSRFDRDLWAQPETNQFQWSSDTQAAIAQMSGEEQAKWAAEQYRLQQLMNPVQSPNDILRERNAEMRRFIELRKDLMGAGVRGGALNELLTSAPLDQLEAMLAGSRRELNDFVKLYQTGERLDRAASVGTANAVYGREITAQTRELKEMKEELREVKQEIRRQGEDGPERTGRAAGGAAGRAIRGELDDMTDRSRRNGRGVNRGGNR